MAMIEFLYSPTVQGMVVLAVTGLVWVLFAWLSHRDTRRICARMAAEERKMALQQQLWEMEAQIREERLSEEEREWRRRYREEQAEVKREARRRLGLPDEESHDSEGDG
jgi:hypothetical protein